MNFQKVLNNNKQLEAIRQALMRLSMLGYCEHLISKRLGLLDISDLSWRLLPIYRKENLVPRDALNCAIDLFLLQGDTSTAELTTLFGQETFAELIGSGLLIAKGERLVSALSCYPVGGFLLFSDHAWPKLPHPGLKEIPHDQVMYIGLDSRWLAHSVPRREFELALDLCTGSGIHALLAAKHSKLVVAVDINQRAAECTILNAISSNLLNMEVKLGDLYGDLNQRFDLITANPPFVPSPADMLGYRDGGHDGESVQRRVVEDLPRFLAKGGIAQVITEIGEKDGEPLLTKVRSWLGEVPMDILILRFKSMSADAYALGHANIDDTYEAYFDDIDRWTSNIKAQGYNSVSSVLLTFKWSEEGVSPWSRIEDVDAPSQDIGFAIEDIFAIETAIRKDGFFELLANHKLSRAKIALLEARELGGAIEETKTQASVLGASLSLKRWLERDELDILSALERPLTLSELSDTLSLSQEQLFDKVCDLIRSGLIIA